jgi:hypothetical protein
MTFKEKLEKVQDEDFARSVKRLRLASWLFGAAVFVALAGVGTALVQNNRQADQITRIESPCIRYGSKSKLCRESFEKAVLTITHAQACAILRKAGLRVPSCAGARLQQEVRRHGERAKTRRESPSPVTGDTGGGDAFQQPSHHGHQPPSPGQQPGPSTPSPAAPPAPGNSGEAPGQSGETPGQSGAQPPAQPSGLGVEVCALEHACIGIDSKGLLP